MLVMAVMAFHYTVAWVGERQDVYGFDHSYSADFAFGALAVQIFFLISGFFITVTLFRSKDALEFLYRRVLRIFPALLVCATLTFLIVEAVGPDIFHVHFGDYIGSLTLIFRFGAKWVDGAYWSLEIEFKYYLWVAFLYWALGKRVWLGVIGIGVAGVLTSIASEKAAENLFLAPYMSYFMFGMAAAYQGGLKQGRVAVLLYAAGLFAFVFHIGHFTLWQNAFVGLGAAVVLFLLVTEVRINLPVLPYLGVISYEIYLIHQKVGITVIWHAKRDLHLPDVVAIGLAAAISIGLAAFVHHIGARPAADGVTVFYKWLRCRISKNPPELAEAS